ncbi:chorismate synthase [Psychroflexus sp. YR1-1]|uniref:Chorismate synthase n=1 Tax=Psychroflexus aurantiacus TaxID=2709310 RepID=A0A6B3QZH2_9FLAO|nr:chorismate synthase [Psychroflexus aurantiacus]NEV93579.1 chorismate synthase [Psychroflexus aurantiacus]
MASNSFGSFLKLTTYGESHGVSIGGILDGVPPGIQLDLDKIQLEMDRRKPGQSSIVTQRKESDIVHFKSGIFEGITTGLPIGFEIQNTDNKSNDYGHIKDVFRPNHADYTYDQKYGQRDHRGGGRSSARETASWVVAGAIAKQILSDVKFTAYTHAVGALELTAKDTVDFDVIEKNPVRCPNEKVASQMEDYIRQIRKEGDTIGGIVKCVISNVPKNLGDPIFEKLHANLGKAMMTINAVKGFDYGSGFEGVSMRGSEHNDLFNTDGSTKTNHSGGIQGGISNGMDITFRVAFKPVATLMQKQQTINKNAEEVEMQGKGRHDPCVVPRAIPVVEAMSALVLADAYLLNKSIH